MKKKIISILICVVLLLALAVGSTITPSAVPVDPTSTVMREKAVTVLDFDNATSVGSYTSGHGGGFSSSITIDDGIYDLPVANETLKDFEDGATGVSYAWNHNKNIGSVAINEDEANAYNGKSIAYTWTEAGSGNSVNGFRLFNDPPRRSGDGIAFWAKAEAKINLRIYYRQSYNDNHNGEVTISLKAGENYVVIPYTAFSNYYDGSGTEPAYIYAMDFYPEIKSTNATGVLYFDNFVTYDEDSISNPNAYGGKGKALKYSTNDNGSNTAISLLGSKIPLKDANGTKWGKEATLCIWINSSHDFTEKLKLKAYDSTTDWWGTVTYYETDRKYTIPKGKSILRVPVSDFYIKGGTGEDTQNFDFLGSLIFNLNSWHGRTDNTVIYIDQISVEFPTIGDVDDDENVDLRDLVKIKSLANDGTHTGSVSVVDINTDGAFDINDYKAYRTHLVEGTALPTAPYVAS